MDWSIYRKIIKEEAKKKNYSFVPVAFVSEHSETLVELDIEYKKLAKKMDLKIIFVFQLLLQSRLY